MKVLEKGNIYSIKFNYDKPNKFFRISCYGDDNENELGYLTFKVSGRYNDCIFAYQLENTSEVGRGVGSALIDGLEYFALQNRINKFEAKFFPTDDRAKSFYEKRGYEIFKDGYETMLFKCYYDDEIEEDVLPKIIEVNKSDEKTIKAER